MQILAVHMLINGSSRSLCRHRPDVFIHIPAFIHSVADFLTLTFIDRQLRPPLTGDYDAAQ